MSRRRPVTVSLVLLLVAGTALAVLLLQRDDRTPARVGHVVDARLDLEEDPVRLGAASVALPGGDLEVAVAARTDVLDAAAEQQAVPPPEGGAYLPVAWRWTTTSDRWDLAALPGAPPSVVAEPAPEVTLTLVQDGIRYPLRAPAPLLPSSEEDRWFPVAVAASDDVSLVVGFDGEEQVVQVGADGPVNGDPGRLAAYDGYERAPDRSERSDEVAAMVPPDLGGGLATTYAGDGTPDSPGDGVLVVRTVSAEPYVTGLGWAPEGETWLVLPLAVDFFGAVRSPVGLAGVPNDWNLYAASPDVRVGVDGATPTPVVVLTPPVGNVLSPGTAGVAVALVPEDTAGVTLQASAEIVELRPYDGLGRADFPDPVTVTWEAGLPVG